MAKVDFRESGVFGYRASDFLVMKLILSGTKQFFVKGEGARDFTEITPDGNLYIDFDPKAAPRRRHTGEMVFQNGIIRLDYDQAGYLAGMEIVECNPFTGGPIEVPEHLQPKNPLKNKV